MVSCKLVEVEQGSDKWDELRAGRLTASRMHKVMSKPTTKGYQQEQQRLVLELLGHREPEADAHWQDHGRQGEPFARGAYCWKFDVEVTADVFCIHPEYDWMAASPDGLVLPDYDKAIEIKCRKALNTYVKKVSDSRRLERIDPIYKPQVQAQMWVMGLDELDYVEFWRDPDGAKSKMHVTTVERDQEYIDRMEERALIFMREAYELADKDQRSLGV